MITQNLIQKKVSILLVITLLITGLFYCPTLSSAATLTKTKTVTKTVKVNDTGSYDIWKHADGTWQYGVEPGDEVTFPATFPVAGVVSEFPEGYTITKITGEFNNNYKSPGYSEYMVKSAEMVGIPSYKASAKEITYNVHTHLTTDSGPYYGRNIKKTEQMKTVEGLRYYTPFTLYITYTYEVTETIESGNFIPDISVPSSAKVGESFSAVNTSVFDDKKDYDHSELKYNIDGGTEITVEDWTGQSLDESILQTFDKICKVNYTLKVYNIYGESKTAKGSIDIVDGRTISGEAVIIPEAPFTYETHPINVYDESTIEVDGEKYSAKRAYKEGIARSSYRVSGGTVKKDGLTSAICVFPKAGFYTVTLTVTLKNGERLTSSTVIEAKKTPCVIDNLSGFQKQNRKQILTFKIATSKGYSLTDCPISIKDLKSSEMANLTPEQTSFVGDTIKTRTVKEEKQNEYWTTLTVEFLTKYPRYSLTGDTTQNFSYKIKVTDSKGDTDEAYKQFEVAPDKPPIPLINMQTNFIRNKGTNTARLEAADGSQSDGDQLLRIWSVVNHNPLDNKKIGDFVNATTINGYENLAFGTNQTIGWDKEGVGKATVKLHVKDVWNEPTLEEYIKPADYLEAETTAQTDVINIAPVVSIEAIDTLKANIALLVKRNQYEDLKNKTNELDAALIEKGIDGNISIIPVVDTYEGNNATRISSKNAKGAQGLGQSMSTRDYTYLIEPVTVNTTSSCTEAISIKLAAYDKNGQSVWSYSFAKKPESHYLLTDNQGKYLICTNSYYNNGTNYVTKPYTLIFNAKTGALLKKIDDIGINQDSKVFLSIDGKRLYIFNSEGIQKIDFRTGEFTNILSSNLYQPRIIGGKVGFVSQMPDMRYCINKFDMTTEICDKLVLPTLDGMAGTNIIDWSNDGKVLVSASNRYYILDAETQSTCKIDCDKKGSNFSTFFIKNYTGKADYVCVSFRTKTWGSHTGTSYYSHLVIYKINTSESIKVEQISSWGLSKKTKEVHLPNVGFIDANEKIYVFGAEFYGRCWIYNLMTKSYEAESDSIASIGLDPITGNIQEYDGGFVSHYYDNGWNGNGSHYYIIRYKTPITSNQSAHKGLLEKADFQNGENYVINMGISEPLDKINNYAMEQGAVKIDMILEQQITEIANKIKEFGEQSKYRLNLIGDGISNITKLVKNINFEADTEYEYSYDMQVVSGSAVDVFDVEKETIQNIDGNPKYKEIVYQADLTHGENNYIKKGIVNYEEGSFHSGEGFSGGETKSKISFNMEKDGYIEFLMDGQINGEYIAEGYSWSDREIYIDGVSIARQHNDNWGPDNWKSSKFTALLEKGSHNVEFETFGWRENTMMKFLEIGYLSTKDNVFEPTTINASLEGNVRQVKGTFKAPKELAYIQGSSITMNTENLFSLQNKGCLKFIQKHDAMWWQFNKDGTSITIHNHEWKRDNVGELQFTAPDNKILYFTSSKQAYAIKPGETIRIKWRLRRTSTYIPIENFKAIFIPINTLGFNLDETMAHGSTIEGLSLDANSNVQTFYNVEFNEQSGKAHMYKNSVARENLYEQISLGTQNSGKNILNAYISDFRLKAIYSKLNAKGTVYENKFNNQFSLNKGWQVQTKGNAKAEMMLVEPAPKDEDAPLVYKKGQLVKYNIFYSDYEKDPSKCGYWLYAHTPFNDGKQPSAAIIYDEDGNIESVCGKEITGTEITIDEALNIAKNKGLKTLAKPIDRFYTDGKYTVYHWEYDDTSRKIIAGGYPNYDKSSNMAELTFYVEGGASAPWITGISTSPTKVKENTKFSINIGIDDAEKDVLNLTTEVYKDRKLIFTHRKKNILPLDSSGNPTTDVAIAVKYPVINTGALPDKAQSGKYEVVCTVRDATGAGLGSYKFIVVSEGKITGMVNHTDKWDINRKKYNLSYFNDEINNTYSYSEYLALKLPRKRGTNVFWSGEKFILNATVASTPTKVTCNIKDTSYNTVMKSTGRKNALGETIYTGSLWDESMINKWGNKTPEEITFHFVATYSGGAVKTHDVKVIVDNMTPYWRLHRAF